MRDLHNQINGDFRYVGDFRYNGDFRCDGDFRCVHCRHQVSCASLVSGVIHRNHCPYCLWSRHMDLQRAGDRLAACKEPMRPIGLTLKRTANKYGRRQSGELMLIHRCQECGNISINRIAADDDPELLLHIFTTSQELERTQRNQLEAEGIRLLQASDAAVVRARLFGWSGAMAKPQDLLEVA